MVSTMRGWRKAGAKVVSILLYSSVEYAEVQSCFLSVIWGTWLVAFKARAPWFTKHGSETLYLLMSVLPRWAWAAIFLFIGIGHLLALLKHRYTVRSLLLFIEVMLWAYIASYIGATDETQVTFPITFTFFLGALWGYLRLRLEIQTRG